jgi:hypothetical protein
MWLRRFMELLRGGPEGRGSEQVENVRSVLLRHSAYDNESQFLAAVLDALAADAQIEDETLRELIAHLRGHYGEELSRIGDDVEAHLGFWRDLAGRFDHPLAAACHADTLLLAGQHAEAMQLFLGIFDRQPTLLYEFGGDLYDVARDLGGAIWLGYQLACLRAGLAEPPDDDYVREMYSELLEEYAGEPAALARVREVGKAIDEAVLAGRLPRALVRRGASRPPKSR